MGWAVLRSHAIKHQVLVNGGMQVSDRLCDLPFRDAHRQGMLAGSLGDSHKPGARGPQGFKSAWDDPVGVLARKTDD